MTGKTHVAAANVSSLAVATFILKNYNVSLETLPTLVAFSSVGGLIADIDHAGSTLGSKFKIFSIIFKHRGFTHTIWFILIICYLLSLMTSIYPVVFLGIGMISHLTCDILTPAGLRPLKLGFNMLVWKVVIPIVQSELIEKVFYYTFVGLFLILLFRYGG